MRCFCVATPEHEYLMAMVPKVHDAVIFSSGHTGPATPESRFEEQAL